MLNTRSSHISNILLALLIVNIVTNSSESTTMEYISEIKYNKDNTTVYTWVKSTIVLTFVNNEQMLFKLTGLELLFCGEKDSIGDTSFYFLMALLKDTNCVYISSAANLKDVGTRMKSIELNKDIKFTFSLKNFEAFDWYKKNNTTSYQSHDHQNSISLRYKNNNGFVVTGMSLGDNMEFETTNRPLNPNSFNNAVKILQKIVTLEENAQFYKNHKFAMEIMFDNRSQMYCELAFNENVKKSSKPKQDNTNVVIVIGVAVLLVLIAIMAGLYFKFFSRLIRKHKRRSRN